MSFPLTLGQVIDTLAAIPDQDRVVSPAFGAPHSDRGYYRDVAFTPVESATVAEMLAHARSAVGETFQGWKGGDFTMSRSTDCWINVYGDCDDDEGGLHEERLAKMLGAPVAESRPSSMPVRPQIIEMHAAVGIGGAWAVVIPDDMWDAFKAYVCELEAIAAKQDA